MGTAWSRRVRTKIISRRRPLENFKTTEADKHSTTGGSTGNNTSSKTTSDRSDVAGHYDRGVEKTK